MEKPQEKIRDINNSLHRIAQKIEILYKQRMQDTKKIDKIIQLTIPKIKYKINDSHFQNKKQKENEISSINMKQKIVQNRLRKKQHQLNLCKSIQNINKSRIQSSKQLRALSRLNQQKVKMIKLKVLEEKRRKKQQVKQTLQKSKKYIQNFHLQKKQFLKHQKDQQKSKTKKRLEQLVKRINQIQSQKNRVLRDRLVASDELQKIKKTFIKLNKMKSSQFQLISNEAGLCQQDLNAQEVEQFLRHINQKYNTINDQNR